VMSGFLILFFWLVLGERGSFSLLVCISTLQQGNHLYIMSHNHIFLFIPSQFPSESKIYIRLSPSYILKPRQNKYTNLTCTVQQITKLSHYRFFALVFAVVLPFGFLPAREGPGAAATGPSTISTSSSETVNFRFKALRVEEAGLVTVLVVAI